MLRGRKTSDKTKNALLCLKKLPLFNLATAKKYGLSQPSVSRLLKRDVIGRVSSGLYQFNDGASFEPDTFEYVKSTEKFGSKVVIGGMTALFRYGLIDEVPEQVWLLAPHTARTHDRYYRMIRTNRSLSVGVIKDKGFKIVSIERAIVDAFIFSVKLGTSTGLQASIRALKMKRTTEGKIFEMAKRLGALKKVNLAWGAVTIALES